MGVELHANFVSGAFGGAPHGATNRVRGVPKWVGETHVDPPTGAFGGAPHGATNDAPHGIILMGMARVRHADPPTGAFGGAPYGATSDAPHGNICSGRRECATRTLPLGPSVELLMGPRNAALGGGTACEPPHWGLRRSSLWGHEPLPWVGETHARAATGAFGGAPYGATKRCPGWGNRMRAVPLGPSVELPMGLQNAALGGGTACAPPLPWHAPHTFRGPIGSSN